MQRIEEYEYHFHCVQDSTYRFQTMKALRYLPLSPTAVDMFLNMMIGHTLQFDLDDHIRPFMLQMETRNLRLNSKPKIVITPTILTIEDCLILSGARTFWILKDKILYRCSEAFKRTCSPI